MSASLVSTEEVAPGQSSARESPALGVDACPTCGTSSSLLPDLDPTVAAKRIVELEAQVRLLTDKATSAVDRIADYEDELRRLRSSQTAGSKRFSVDPALALTPSTSIASEDGIRPHTANPTGAAPASRMSRFSSLLTRKSISGPSSSGPSVTPLPSALPHRSDDDELRDALEKERCLRRDAETKVSAMSSEIEELSVTLFQQANEMVAEERRARAKLEERVAVLEKRDKEKRSRLERLENAVKRIDRVRGLLAT
ncbi:uncharacterized protein K452DRAFT_233427 [Aplosporella prunicola CBS 121167]|uniref:GDP/GTP exchange factor Sec2 N-terminal domain-containing protein n=1 Tax=Aplosporella prunicola CBS 121167 TaxID=1176127 RepID=A0A6A6B6V1_9PEZI|nr:uncharacterized protein K452DRAFT_233427 [Aplosporella prunicola CBS 121167]KAF2138717.1 hypothetical protein K452DRAFT_233427 [Aplosporella prunicola CBS 121167]